MLSGKPSSYLVKHLFGAAIVRMEERIGEEDIQIFTRTDSEILW
jgi:hypothetical protein